ncbi:MAG: FxsA family protein [Deltaproteobacteria bacterium]|nr:FxsA family protein [Deltaproteobacteria bacterium]MBT4264978.1 FxsA family protein [Deltaproteobacteria bacterium]MBT4644479.1 FxsA family protein [Deltaproteobacteria bacterium]MBT6503302.1 FxsA family protein [Deltaproteobacteria bacterium]MBT6616381.1 FxsA family protein [Deltaproteobacteria bacterium]
MFIEFLFLVSLGVALADMIILIQISSGPGIYFIIGSQLLTCGYGIFRIRKLDFNLFFFLDAELKKGEKIVKEIWIEAWILTAVCFLIIPGLVSDIIGGVCLTPAIRRFFLEYVSEIY